MIATFPIGTAPRVFSSWITWLSKIFSLPDPFWPSNVPIQPMYAMDVSRPLIWNWSLSVTGRPCSGPTSLLFCPK